MSRATTAPDHLQGLETRGLKVVLAKQPTVVVGHGFTTGQIPRVTDFEKPPALARLVAGPMHSACSVQHFGVTKVETKPGELVADRFQGEHATCYHVKDRGLVVFTSCGHAGVINSVRHAQKASGVGKVHAVMGGFHLAPAPDYVVAKTVAAFRDIDPDYMELEEFPARSPGCRTSCRRSVPLSSFLTVQCWRR